MAQFGPALNVEVFCANSFYVKDRVERANRTLQECLVKELRLAGTLTWTPQMCFCPIFHNHASLRAIVSAQGFQSKPTPSCAKSLDRILLAWQANPMHALFPICLTVLGVVATSAQSDCSSDAVIVFDGSGSMAEMGFNDIQEPRIFEARRAMANAIPQISQARRLGLVIYGPNGADECSGIDLRFAPIADAAPKILADVNALEPAGSTPLAEAVKLAVETLDYQNKPATVVVVTDGKETCGGQPCALAVDLAANGMDTTVHVIGFKVRATFFSWDKEVNGSEAKVESVSRCLADSTGGTYTSAETLDQLIAALKETLGCQLLF